MCIGAFLEKNGFNVKIIDAHLEKLSLIKLSEQIIKQNPDIIGITTDSINYYDSLRIAKLAKITLNATVVMGGPHATLRGEELLKYPEVDIVVLGEGEYTMLEIVQRIERGLTLKGCKGCYYKENDKIIINPLRERIQNLNLLPRLARHLVPYKYYPRNYTFGGIKTPVDTVSTSRGCPYNCSYCSSREIWGPQYKTRNPKDVIDEIEYLINEFGTKGIYFREDNFTLNKKHVLGICEEIIKRKINIEWECSSRVDLVNKQVLKKMYQAGCKSIWFGIETGSPRMLKKLNKGIKIEQVRKAVQITREAGIRVGGSFMMGMPGETKEDLRMTVKLIKELALIPTSLATFVGIPDSQLYHEIIENGWIESAYGEVLFVKHPILSKEYLKAIKRYVEKELYFLNKKENLNRNPKYILTYLLNGIKQPKKILNFLKNLPKILN